MSTRLAIALAVCATPLLAAVPDGWFPFVIPLVDDSNTLVSVAHMNATPAGQEGFLVCRDGPFVDGKGRRVRFLATNLTFGGCFPTHEQAEQVAALGRDALTRMADLRVAGKAFTVSEYNHPAPNDFRAECVPMLAAFAALQDWDGLFYFDYGKPAEGEAAERVNGYFSINTDLTKMAFLPIAANLFRRGDVQAARQVVRLSVPAQQVAELLAKYQGDVRGIWQAAGVGPLAPMQHRVELELSQGDKITATQPVQIAESNVTSDTGEITGDARDKQRALFAVDTPKTKLIIGFVGDRKVELKGFSLALAPGAPAWIAAAVTAMDDRPLSESQRVLLVLLGRVGNQDMGWNADRTTVSRAWGKGPGIAQGVRAQIELATKQKPIAKALDGAGAPKADVPSQAQGGRLSLTTGPEQQTLWYGLVAQ